MKIEIKAMDFGLNVNVRLGVSFKDPFSIIKVVILVIPIDPWRPGRQLLN